MEDLPSPTMSMTMSTTTAVEGWRQQLARLEYGGDGDHALDLVASNSMTWPQTASEWSDLSKATKIIGIKVVRIDGDGCHLERLEVLKVVDFLVALFHRNNPELVTVHVNNCGINDQHIRSLVAAMKQHDYVADLDFSCNHIGNGGARELAEVMRVHPSLTHLDLSGNSVGDLGFTELTQAFNSSPRMKRFYIRGNLEVSDAAFTMARKETNINEFMQQQQQEATNMNYGLPIIYNQVPKRVKSEQG
jgi:hypothetical protein